MLLSQAASSSHVRELAFLFSHLPTRTSPSWQIDQFLSVDLHLLPNARLTIANILHRDVLGDVLLGDDLLVQHGRRAALEFVVALLRLPLVGREVIPQQLRLLLRDDAHVHVRARSQVVPDTRFDGVGAQRHGFLARQVRLPLRLEHAHRRQAAAAHRHVGQLVGGAVRVHGEQVRARGVAAGYYEVRADVALVPEQVLLQHGHDGHDARFAAGREGVQLEVGGHQGRGELGVGRCAGAGAPDLRCDVVQLLAVLVRKSVWRVLSSRGMDVGYFSTYLVCYYGTAGCASVGGDDDAAIVEGADDGCSGRCGFGERHAFGVEGEVAVVV